MCTIHRCDRQTVTLVGSDSMCKIHRCDRQLHWWVVIVCVQYTGVLRQLHWWVVIVCVKYTCDRHTVILVGSDSICKIHRCDRQLHCWVVIVCVKYTDVIDSYTGG